MFPSRDVVAVCAVAWLAMQPLSVLAQSGSPGLVSISVGAAYESALALSPEFQSHKKRVDALTAKRESSQALTAEALSLQGSYRTDRNHNNQGLRETELGLSAPLWNWNERSRTQSLQDSELQSALLQYESAKLDLAGEVRQLIWDALSLQLDVDVTRARVESARKLMTDVERRVEAGELAKTDLFQAQAFYAKANGEMERAAAGFSELGLQFSDLTGLPASAWLHIQNEAVDLTAALQPKDHPHLKKARAQLQVLANRTDLILVQRRPNVELGVSIISDRAALGVSDEKSLLFSTRIPLGNSAEHQSRLMEAQANQLAAQASVQKTERVLASKIRSAQSNVEVFDQMRVSASEQATLAQRIHALYRKSFELGETDMPTLLLYEQQAFEAERLARKSEIEYAAKVSAYKQALGLLPE